LELRTLPATSLLALAVSLSLTASVPAFAQETPSPEPAPTPAPSQTQPPPATNSQIVVSAQSLRGKVDTPQPPLLELTEADIAA
jgi:hypothetical protein